MIDALNRLIGGDDLIAVMTPDMSAQGITFTRRTGSIEQMLSGLWGRKGLAGHKRSARGPVRVLLRPPSIVDGPWMAREMIARRREMRTLDALDELVQHLRGASRRAKSGHHDVRRMAAVRARPQPREALIDPKTDGLITGGQTQVPVPKIGRDPQTGRIATERSSCRHDDHERRHL